MLKEFTHDSKYEYIFKDRQINVVIKGFCRHPLENIVDSFQYITFLRLDAKLFDDEFHEHKSAAAKLESLKKLHVIMEFHQK